jgi:hypothetical protein
VEFVVAGASPLCEPWVRGADLPQEVLDKVADTWAREAAATVASEVLFNLSGRLWRGGACAQTVEVDTTTGYCWSDLLTAPVWAINRDTNTVGNAWWSFRLPDFPVTEVISVAKGRVTPVTVAPNLYRLVNARELQRVDGQTWDGIYQVRYLYGARPPPGALRAASILAGEFALATAGLTCRLPKRVSSITRQGVSMTVLDSLDLFDKGRTGVPEVDSWLGSVNPTRARPSRVWSPDIDPDFSVLDKAGAAPAIPHHNFEYIAGARFDPTFRWRQRDGSPVATTGKHAVWQLADPDGTIIETRSAATGGSGLTLTSPGVWDLVVLGDVTDAWPSLSTWEFQLVSDADAHDIDPLGTGNLIRTEQGVPG